ncbi:hypothetical protein [Streptomyces sp. Ru72]|uniref:hypothetical protein n=1 Tax=Streptomyces sp. Ru72 TaxID=2080747 RepID=UPI000CDD350D|nr:hypothetical protein [Streptomyces sp. Ru72]POX44151.1 hypothetical protein C3488_33785 [Streptomyces sp. Ru72]
MTTGTLLAIIIPAVGVIALIALGSSLLMRRRRLRERFGPEYQRTVAETGSRRAAERELIDREQRHDALNVKPLPTSIRDRYTREWATVQEEFVDRPEDAVHDADRLVTSLMHERGYPTEDFEDRLKDLSVEHSRTLEHYRAAHAIDELSTRHKADTEQLRNALVHYRALLEDLLTDGGQPRPAGS